MVDRFGRTSRLRSCRMGGRHLHLRFEEKKAFLIADGVSVYTLNHEAAFITDLLMQGRRAAEIKKIVSRHFRRIDAAVLGEDIASMKKLLGHLVTGSEPCAFSPGGREKTFTKSSYDEVLDPGYPFRADLALTYSCPNRCSHCYAGSENNPPGLDAETWKQIIARLADIGVPYLCFTGGEPTLMRCLAELVSFASGLGLITGVLTGGRRFCDRDYAASLKDAGLDYVQITLESGSEAVHNEMTGRRAWHETVEGIKSCVAEGMVVVTNTTLTRANLDTAALTAAFSASLGVKSVAANTIIATGKARANGIDAVPCAWLPQVVEDMQLGARAGGARFLWYSPTPYCMFNPFELDLGVKRCSAASGSIAIDPSGKVLPCQSFFVPAGDILADDWEDIRNGPVFSRVRSWRSGIYACGDCPDAGLCRGGCPLQEDFDLELRRCPGAYGTAATTGKKHGYAAL
ncbi:MAG: radical SAM protein [Pseudomonadota bacterium]